MTDEGIDRYGMQEAVRCLLKRVVEEKYLWWPELNQHPKKFTAQLLPAAESRRDGQWWSRKVLQDLRIPQVAVGLWIHSIHGRIKKHQRGYNDEDEVHYFNACTSRNAYPCRHTCRKPQPSLVHDAERASTVSPSPTCLMKTNGKDVILHLVNPLLYTWSLVSGIALDTSYHVSPRGEKSGQRYPMAPHSFHDYPTIALSALMFHSDMKGLRDCTIGKTVFHNVIIIN